MLEASYQGLPGAPQYDHHHMKINAHAMHETQPDPAQHAIIQRQQTESPAVARLQTEVTIQFATANVLTLYDQNRGGRSYISARQEAIMEQMYNHGVPLRHRSVDLRVRPGVRHGT